MRDASTRYHGLAGPAFRCPFGYDLSLTPGLAIVASREAPLRVFRLLLSLLGAALFVGLVVQIGPGQIMAQFRDLSWRLGILLFFPFCLVTAADTLGWRYAFRRDTVPYATLLGARLAGEAFNTTTPTASVGGEAVKAWLLRRWVPMSESLPSVIVAKTTITIAQALFLLLGLAVAGVVMPEDSALLYGMRWLLVLEVLAVGGFVLVQVMGALGGGGRILQRLGVMGEGAGAELGRVDQSLVSFYRLAPGRLVLSTAAHFLGWAFSAVEAYVILRAMGLPVSFLTAVVIEAFGTGVRFISFMIPAHLGALEGGHVATFAALGLGGPTGLTFSLVRRLREAAWTGIGFIVLSALREPGRAGPVLEPEA